MLSIIIPAYNEEKNLHNTLNNLEEAINSKFINHEIIIVDDCSTDNSSQIINELSKKNRNIISIKNSKNLGFGSSFKNGLKVAKGDWIMMLQGDNAWNSDNLKKLYSYYNERDLLIQINSKMLSERGFFRWSISKIFTILLNLFRKKKIKYYNGLQIHKKEYLNKIKIEESQYCFQAEILLKTIKEYDNFKYVDMQSQSRDYGYSKAFKLKNILSTLQFLIKSQKY